MSITTEKPGPTRVGNPGEESARIGRAQTMNTNDSTRNEARHGNKSVAHAINWPSVQAALGERGGA